MKQLKPAILAAAVALSFLFVVVAHAAPTICQISNGCLGTSTAPSYGKVLIGGKHGEYETVASSTFGGGGSAASSTLLSDSNTFTGVNALATTTTIMLNNTIIV